MQDRMNTIETQLDTDFKAESDITDEFDSTYGIINELPDDIDDVLGFKLPALCFEALTCSPVTRGDYWENVNLVICIIVEDAQKNIARSEARRLLSLVRTFLRSTSWTYASETQIEESGFGVGVLDDRTFRAVGVIPISVHAHFENVN